MYEIHYLAILCIDRVYRQCLYPVFNHNHNHNHNHTIPPTLHHDCLVADSDTDKANMFNAYFYSVFTPAETNHSLPTDNSSHFSSINITEEDVYNALINLDTSKAMGPDGIPSIVLSKCASVLYRPFHHLFSLILRYSYLPRDWKIHKIIPVFKSGDPTQVKNYQPISLLCNISKVLERIIYKLINHVSSQINPAQFGFMQNQSTTQQLLTFLSNALPLIISWTLYIWI